MKTKSKIKIVLFLKSYNKQMMMLINLMMIKKMIIMNSKKMNNMNNLYNKIKIGKAITSERKRK